jgi:hypothetical protein
MLQQHKTTTLCTPNHSMHQCHTHSAQVNLCVHSALSKDNARVPHHHPAFLNAACIMLTAYRVDVDLCCPALPCLAPVHAPSTAIPWRPCFTTTAPGERWSRMHWWHVGMQRPPVVPASSCCKLFCKTTCWSHGKGCCSLNCNLSMD